MWLIAWTIACTSPPSETDTDVADTDVADTDVADTDVADTDVADTDVSDPDACAGGTSTLSGVCIDFEGSGATFTLAEAAAGIAIPYAVVATEPHEVVAATQDAGECGQPDASGLIVFERLDGGDQHYCVCDTGRCAGWDTASTVPIATTARRFAWTGRNWDGPSDTMNPQGDPFPAGTYTLTVSARGTLVDGPAFEVRNTFAITLVP